MKKSICLLLFCFAIISCNNQSGTKDNKRKSGYKIEHYLDTIQNRFVNHEKNSVIQAELNDFLKEDFKNSVNNGIISDLPMKLESIEKCNKNYILKLQHSLISKYSKGELLDMLHIELYAITDEKTARGLNQGDYYVGDYEFNEYLDFGNKDKYCLYTLWAPFRGFGKGMSLSKEIEFGGIGVNLKSITPVSN